MYSSGVFSREASRWCIECWAMYAKRKLWCTHTSPTSSEGVVSPTSSFIIVVLPEKSATSQRHQ